MTNANSMSKPMAGKAAGSRLGMLALAISLVTTGCASLEPRLPEAQPNIRAEWPLPPTTQAPETEKSTASPEEAGEVAVADIGWRDFFVDDNLQQLIAQALENNRDLRVAVLNVERVRAQYRIQRADRLPSVGVTGTAQRSGGDNNLNPGELYSVELGVSRFELDLFGRVRNLSEAALQQYFAQEEARRSAQLALIAELANAYLTLAADRERLQVAEQTLKTYEESYALSKRRYELGALSALELVQAETEVASARAEVARYQGNVAQSMNALNLLVGAPVDEQLLPEGLVGQVTGLMPLPAGLPSDVLLRRPDIQRAEYLLRSANANIGAARAAFFPSITLTGNVGFASDELSGLFNTGNRLWSFIPQVNIPIFQAGRLRGGLDVATANRDIALAQYEQAIQSGFREVADALALTQTLAQQSRAQEAVVEAARRADKLAEARYRAGQDSYLVRLDAQRVLYEAQQGLVAIRLAEQANRVTLYRVLGGGWQEKTQ